MAVTKGHGNPTWTLDETLLALQLYFECDGVMPDKGDRRVEALSAELRALPIHSQANKNETFRNPAGVAFKLQNLRQVATGKGLDHSSEIDRKVWTTYGHDPLRVRELAKVIRDGAKLVSEPEVGDIDDLFSEGHVVTALHKKRERSPKLRKKLLDARLAANALTCDACGDGPKSLDPKLGSACFEAHHRLPLAASGPTITRLRDLALLCATCHRLIHRASSIRGQWVSVEELQQMLTQK